MTLAFVDAASIVGGLRQGHVLRVPVLPVMTAPGGMHPQAPPGPIGEGAFEDLAIAGLAEVPSGLVMIATQTCDLQVGKTRAGRALALAAPVVLLDDPTLRDALRDTRPNYVKVPWVADNAFADLDQLGAIDRELLAIADVVAAPPETERRPLAYRLGRYFQRAALPDDVNRALVPISRFADAHSDEMQEVLSSVVEIRVGADKSFEDEPPYELTVLLIVDLDWLPDLPPALKFRDTGDARSICAAMTAVRTSTDSEAPGQLVLLWNRLANALEKRLTENLRARSNGAVSNVVVVPSATLTPGQISQTDIFDLGHLSLDRSL